MSHYAGWQKHLHLAKESAWGEAPSGGDLYLPFAEYDVRPRVLTSEARLFTGQRQRLHHRVARATLEGSLECPLYSFHLSGKSVAQHLLEWLLSAPAAVELDSYTARLAEAGVADRRHVGLRPAAGVLSGGADASSVRLRLDLMGKAEEPIAVVPALSPTAPRPTEFLFKDATATLAGEPVELRSFEIRVTNNLAASHTNSYWPSLLTAGTRQVQTRLSFFKTSAVFDAMRRSPPEETSAVLVLKGAHDGTGPPDTTFTTVTLTFGRLAFADAIDAGSLDELVRQDVDFVALKPISLADELEISFGAIS